MSSSSLVDEPAAAALDDHDAASAPRPRLCHLRKWADFKGYGFNLHAERAKQGQHIGKVDDASPAESAGLCEHDRIVEVNNVNISNENHQQVVKRIRSGLELDGVLHDDQVLLLVVDKECDEYYKSRGVVVRHDMSCVLRLKTPMERPSTTDDNNNHTSEQKTNSKRTSSTSSASSSVSSVQQQQQEQPVVVASTVVATDVLHSPSTSATGGSSASSSTTNVRNNNNNNSNEQQQQQHNNSTLSSNSSKSNNTHSPMSNKTSSSTSTTPSSTTSSSVSPYTTNGYHHQHQKANAPPSPNHINNNNNNSAINPFPKIIESFVVDKIEPVTVSRDNYLSCFIVEEQTPPNEMNIDEALAAATAVSRLHALRDKSMEERRKSNGILHNINKKTALDLKEKAKLAFEVATNKLKEQLGFANENNGHFLFNRTNSFASVKQNLSANSNNALHKSLVITKQQPPPRPRPPTSGSVHKYNLSVAKDNNDDNNSIMQTSSIRNTSFSNMSVNSQTGEVKQQSVVIDQILEMSAAEFKNYLKSKGRNDPRIAPVDMKKKYEIFQDM